MNRASRDQPPLHKLGAIITRRARDFLAPVSEVVTRSEGSPAGRHLTYGRRSRGRDREERMNRHCAEAVHEVMSTSPSQWNRQHWSAICWLSSIATTSMRFRCWTSGGSYSGCLQARHCSSCSLLAGRVRLQSPGHGTGGKSDAFEYGLRGGPGTDFRGWGLMVARNLRSPPVVERRESVALVGMVSRGDVLRGLRFQLVEGRDVGRRTR